MVGTNVFGGIFTLQVNFVKMIAEKNRRAAEAYWNFIRSVLETSHPVLHGGYATPQGTLDREWMERVAYLKALE